MPTNLVISPAVAYGHAHECGGRVAHCVYALFRGLAD